MNRNLLTLYIATLFMTPVKGQSPLNHFYCEWVQPPGSGSGTALILCVLLFLFID